MAGATSGNSAERPLLAPTSISVAFASFALLARLIHFVIFFRRRECFVRRRRRWVPRGPLPANLRVHNKNVQYDGPIASIRRGVHHSAFTNPRPHFYYPGAALLWSGPAWSLPARRPTITLASLCSSARSSRNRPPRGSSESCSNSPVLCLPSLTPSHLQPCLWRAIEETRSPLPTTPVWAREMLFSVYREEKNFFLSGILFFSKSAKRKATPSPKTPNRTTRV